jgi:hypothetical protein
MVKRKVGLGGDGGAARATTARASVATTEVLELFFNTGVVYHEVTMPEELPDVVAGFKVMKDPAGSERYSVRRTDPGEEPDVEISVHDHLHELANRWLPVPYQLSCPYAVQMRVALGEGGAAGARVLLAIDTLEKTGAQGKHLDAALDAGRPFRPLDRTETATFLDHTETREMLRRMEKAGIQKAAFKLAALYEALAPILPRLRFAAVDASGPIDVSLVLDLGNSRTTAVLVEARDQGVFAIPLELRSASNPFVVEGDAFDSRVTFLPSAFDRQTHPVAVGDSFAMPSIVKMGREALDRALETPHRYLCTLSGPKRYLWDERQTDERWHFAVAQDGEYRPIFGKLLKYLVEEQGGLQLREDGPQVPPDPKYPPRTVMLFALVEIVSQAIAQINSVKYRSFQGKEQNPRVLRHVALTYPSAMREEEKQVYEGLVRNATWLAGHVLNLAPQHRPNYDAQQQAFRPFLFVDEALAAQMVYVYQETEHTFGGSFEELAGVYGRKQQALRVASIDIGGGTSDVMIAEYTDRQPGAGTSLVIKKLFQDGVSIAGDEVCRAILEDVVFTQILSQVASAQGRTRVANLFAEGDAGHGATWRTLRAKLVPHFWMPLARCYWALAEGFEIPDHNPEKLYLAPHVFEQFGHSWSPQVVAEADKFLCAQVPDFPGLGNLFLRFDRQAVEQAIQSVLREPLRKYADIVAQFDVDVLVLAGRTSALKCIHDLFLLDMPVSPPRIKRMSSYRVGEWYPSKWQEGGQIKDPKTTVTAGAAVLHLASKNKLPGFLLDEIQSAPETPIYGLYQDTEPHMPRQNELFRANKISEPFLYTAGMMIGFRNVDSEEMDACPLFEVRPATKEVEQALLEDRVNLQFTMDKGRLVVSQATSMRGLYTYSPSDFTLGLKTITSDRYWLDTGVFRTA